MQHNSLWALHMDSAESILRDLGRELTAHFDAAPQSFLVTEPAGQKPVPYTVTNGVARITVYGVIDRTARISWFTGLPYTAGQDSIRAALQSALEDSAVRAILLDMDSPGGVVAGTKELADFIAEAATRKPCAAYANGLCASAAYWLASATGRVYSPLTATVGSIGVIAVLTDWSKATEKYGVVRNIISGGKWKAAGSPDKPLTDEERDYFQAQITELHSIFKADVAMRMNISAATERWAEGQTLLAAEAKALGLVSLVVRDVDAAAADLAARALVRPNHKEKSMDSKQHEPDAQGQATPPTGQEAAAGIADAVTMGKESILALVKAVAGEETANKVRQLAAVGVNPEQLAALTLVLGTAAEKPAVKDSEAEARQQVLDAITQNTGGPLLAGGDVQKTSKSALVADAERRAAAQRMV